MIYKLQHCDTHLITFTATENSYIPEIDILWINDKKRELFPLDLKLTSQGLSNWIKDRIIPKDRIYSHNLLSKCRLSHNRPIKIIQISKGLSLTDCYWVVEENFSGKYENFNLYDNRFSRVLALIAFTGYGSNVRTSLISCPEFTTNGMLPKCWRRVDGKIKLFKGGTIGASNTGNEPYSEFYAAQIAKILGVDAIGYGLSKWQGVLCSTCDLFTSKEYSFVPVGRLVTSGGMKAVAEYYDRLGPEYVTALKHMLVFDAVICNVDRHFGNFGFMVDNRTNTIAAPAPLFDHGNSLFNFMGQDEQQSDAALTAYADSLLPCVYDDFIGTAWEALTPELHEGLRQLTTWKIKKHSRYNLPQSRLNLIQSQVQKRAKLILGK